MYRGGVQRASHRVGRWSVWETGEVQDILYTQLVPALYGQGRPERLKKPVGN